MRKFRLTWLALPIFVFMICTIVKLHNINKRLLMLEFTIPPELRDRIETRVEIDGDEVHYISKTKKTGYEKWAEKQQGRIFLGGNFGSKKESGKKEVYVNVFGKQWDGGVHKNESGQSSGSASKMPRDREVGGVATEIIEVK